MLTRVYFLLLFCAGFAMAQLTRNVDLPAAIGIAVLTFATTVGLALMLAAMVFGAVTVYRVVTDGTYMCRHDIGDLFRRESVTREQRT